VRSHAYHAIARALGITPTAEGSLCALCGASPFAAAGPVSRVVSANFADGSLLGAAPDICAGCARCLAGRPGDQPPPLRMTSFVVVAGEFRPARYSALWDLLERPPEGEHAISWATGGKRHHWLHAGISTAAHQVIGADAGAIDHYPDDDRELRAAVRGLLDLGFTRATIRDGAYHPQSIARAGWSRWQHLEARVSVIRPSALLDLLTTVAPRPPKDATPPLPPEATTVIDPTDDLAAVLLAHLARSSGYRRAHGKEFWAGTLHHRLQGVRTLPLADAVARLLERLECSCSDGAGAVNPAVALLADLDEEQQVAVSRAWRDRPALLVALAYDRTRPTEAS